MCVPKLDHETFRALVKRLIELENKVARLEGMPQSKDEISAIVVEELKHTGLIDKAAEDE